MKQNMNIIRDLRKSQGLMQKELAEMLQVAQNTLSTWELGKYDPSIKALNQMADIFGVSVDYILGRTDEPAEETQQEEKKEQKETSSNKEFSASTQSAKVWMIVQKLYTLDPDQLAAIELIVNSMMSKNGED